MATPSLADLRYAFYGGGSAAEYAYLQTAQAAGISAQNIIGLGYRGVGNPEGVTVAPVGSLYTDSVTGARYSKNSGVGNTGWTLLGGGGGLLGEASSSALYTVTNVLSEPPGMSIPIPAGTVPTGSDINIYAECAWVDTPSAGTTFAACILEDNVVLNEAAMSIGGTASAIISIGCKKMGHTPAAGDHNYYLHVQTTAGTCRLFGELTNPIVMTQLLVEAA